MMKETRLPLQDFFSMKQLAPRDFFARRAPCPPPGREQGSKYRLQVALLTVHMVGHLHKKMTAECLVQVPFLCLHPSVTVLHHSLGVS